MDLALNNLQRLICHKTQTTNQQLKHRYNNKDEDNTPNTLNDKLSRNLDKY